jgi:hypothetical protein
LRVLTVACALTLVGLKYSPETPGGRTKTDSAVGTTCTEKNSMLGTQRCTDVSQALHLGQQRAPPARLVHVSSPGQPPLLTRHSLTSVQSRPSPVYPALQVQRRAPGVLVQMACSEHPPLLKPHSSMSTQLTPSRTYPGGQMQTGASRGPQRTLTRPTAGVKPAPRVRSTNSTSR